MTVKGKLILVSAIPQRNAQPGGGVTGGKGGFQGTEASETQGQCDIFNPCHFSLECKDVLNCQKVC